MRPRWRSEGPEAIDGASLATAASAEDGDPAGFLMREEWPRSGKGKKLDGRHCAIGDRGAAGLRPDQPIEEAVWSGRLTGIVQGGNGSSECPGLCPAKARKSSLPCRPVRCIPSDATRCETKPIVVRHRSRCLGQATPCRPGVPVLHRNRRSVPYHACTFLSLRYGGGTRPQPLSWLCLQ